MRIAVNTRLLLKGKLEGIGWFSYETLSRITKQHPEHEFIFLFDRPFNKDFLFAENVKGAWMGPPTRHIKLFHPWFEWVLPWMLKRSKADLFLSPDGHISLSTKVPTVDVIHDLNFHHMPETLPPAIRDYYNSYFPRFAQQSKRIATVSEYTKQDLVKSYGIDEAKIDVTWNGCNTRYQPLSENEISATRQKYTNGKPYFLFIGLIIPRKNLHRLLTAFDQFRTETGLDVDLIVVGERKWWDETHETAFSGMKHQENVKFLGRLEPEELARVLGSALALTYVPVFEGFGIPILEGFAAGVPVLTSNVTSMPEVAGDAAVYADPFSIESIADGLKQIATEKAGNSMRVERGFERKKQFSWDKTAGLLWNCIEKAM